MVVLYRSCSLWSFLNALSVDHFRPRSPLLSLLGKNNCFGFGRPNYWWCYRIEIAWRLGHYTCSDWFMFDCVWGLWRSSNHPHCKSDQSYLEHFWWGNSNSEHRSDTEEIDLWLDDFNCQDTLNESCCLEGTVSAIAGRTIHTYHTEVINISSTICNLCNRALVEDMRQISYVFVGSPTLFHHQLIQHGRTPSTPWKNTLICWLSVTIWIA